MEEVVEEARADWQLLPSEVVLHIASFLDARVRPLPRAARVASALCVPW